MRTRAYGEDSKFTIVDKLGVYLSEKMVLRHLASLKNEDISILELGCGYHASLLRKLAPSAAKAYGVDLAVSDEVKSLSNVRIFEGKIENSFVNFPPGSLDIVMMINVLEHLDSPLFVLKECYKILKAGGLLLVNVPTWRGKFFLETSAYVFHLSPKSEIDDHKMYFDKKSLWPFLVEAGFKPSEIHLKYHKLGLNLFAACNKR
jgi:SAM-dependent methyltransferase